MLSLGRDPPAIPQRGFGARHRFRYPLRRLRKRAGLSQQELASRAGLSLNTVNTLERGVRKHPYPHTVGSLAADLDLSEEGLSALLVESAKPVFLRPEYPVWSGRIEREHDNVREVLRWVRESGEVCTGLRLVGALSWFW